MASAMRLDLAALSDFGLERLLAAAGALVTDNTPAARIAAKQLLPLVRTSFVASAGISDESGSVDVADEVVQQGDATCRVRGAVLSRLVDAEGRPKERTAWETFVYENTSASAAIALLKI